MRQSLSVLAVAMIIAPMATAQIYKWVDESGKVHYSDRKPASKPVEEVTVKVNTYENVSFEAADGQEGRGIVMYGTSWCGYCQKARRYFRDIRLDYQYYDIEKDRAAKAQYDKLGATGVPVILVGKRRMNGFNPAGFERLMEKAKVEG